MEEEVPLLWFINRKADAQPERVWVKGKENSVKDSVNI